MRYVATMKKEDGQYLVEFPHAPGCQTFGITVEEAREAAQEALEGWLEAHLVSGKAPSRPPVRIQAEGKGVFHVHVPPRLAVKLEIRWARQDRGMTQGDLAQLLGMKQPMVVKLEDPDYNPGLEVLQKVAAALGLHWEMELHA